MDQNRAMASGSDSGETGFMGRSVVAVVGKGGVGKTTIAAVLAEHLASKGQSVLLIDVEGKHDLAELFGHERLTARPTVLAAANAAGSPSSIRRGEIRGCSVAPETALTDYLVDHGLGALSKRLASTGAIDVIATSTPGIKDLLVLGRIKSYVNEATFGVVIIDTPASGHAVTFLQGPEALARSVGSGTISRQANEIKTLLTNEHSGVLLVTLAEETPINETIETAFALEEHVGIALLGVAINVLVPPVPQSPRAALDSLEPGEREALESVLSFERSRVLRQNEHVRALADRLPLPQLQLLREPTQALDHVGIASMAKSFGQQLETLRRKRG